MNDMNWRVLVLRRLAAEACRTSVIFSSVPTRWTISSRPQESVCFRVRNKHVYSVRQLLILLRVYMQFKGRQLHQSPPAAITNTTQGVASTAGMYRHPVPEAGSPEQGVCRVCFILRFQPLATGWSSSPLVSPGLLCAHTCLCLNFLLIL